MTEPQDKELAFDLSKQEDLLKRAYETGDDCIIEAAVNRVVTVRRMKKNGLFGWATADL